MRAAVLGSPIEHSLSPDLHNAGYAAVGLDGWHYERHRVEADALPGFVAGLDADWRGLSLTMPLKQACLRVAAEATAVATAAGAGNTLVRLSNGEWLADNTDVGGLVDALAPHWRPEWARAAVLGSGATAHSTVLASAMLGAEELTCYARNRAAAADLVAWAAQAAPQLTVSTEPLERWRLGSEPVVLSTLPGGVADRFALLDDREGLLFDAVYAGWPTPLARAAEAAGMMVVGGFELLVHQAARQFELFTGVAAPLAAMRAAGQARLRPASAEAAGGGAR